MAASAHTPYANVATVLKTSGLKGEVVVRCIAASRIMLPPGAEVFFTPPAMRGINSAHVASMRQGAGSCSISFKEVTNATSAHSLVGRTILAHRSDLVQDGDGGEMSSEDLVGRDVTCANHGYLGKIEDVFSAGGANDVWQVEGPFGEVLIPVIDEVVLDVPENPASQIRVRLLAGLIDGEAEDLGGEDTGDGGEDVQEGGA